MRAITSLCPDAPPRTTFTVTVSIPGHPPEEYTVETFNYNNPEERMTFVATQEGAQVTQNINMGALLSMLLEM